MKDSSNDIALVVEEKQEEKVSESFNGLVICSASDSHISEIAELWANLASIQQIYAPERYSFKGEGKDWRAFVRRKLSKEENLLLVVHDLGSKEIKGFLYLQCVKLPNSNVVVKGVIEDIYTKPQYRRMEIATKLLNVALKWAGKNGLKCVDMMSFKGPKDQEKFLTNLNIRLDVDVELKLFSI